MERLARCGFSPYANAVLCNGWTQEPKACRSGDGECLARDGRLTAWQSGLKRGLASADWPELPAEYSRTVLAVKAWQATCNHASVSSSNHYFSSPPTSYHGPNLLQHQPHLESVSTTYEDAQWSERRGWVSRTARSLPVLVVDPAGCCPLGPRIPPLIERFLVSADAARWPLRPLSKPLRDLLWGPILPPAMLVTQIYCGGAMRLPIPSTPRACWSSELPCCLIKSRRLARSTSWDQLQVAPD